MNILGIESSCDDTGLAIVDSSGQIIAHVTSSQHQIHAKYGGIVPELASRDHVKKFIPLLDFLLNKAKLSKEVKCEKIEGLDHLDKVINIDLLMALGFSARF